MSDITLRDLVLARLEMDRAADVMTSINKEAGRPAGDTFKACNAGAHGKLDVVPIDLIRNTDKQIWDQLSASASPQAVGLDPLGTVRGRRRQGQIEDRNHLAIPTVRADRNDLVAIGQIDASDGDRHTQHGRLEGHRKVLLDRRVEAPDLL